MLTNFFSKTKPSTIIVILLLFLCYFFFAFFNNTDGLLNLKAAPLFLLTLALITFIDIKNNLSFDNTYTLLFFTILIIVFSNTLNIGISFYSNITLLLFLRKVYSLQSPKEIFKKLFDAGLWLGITFILEPFSILFVIFLYSAIIIHQKVNIQGILIPIFGFVVPVFLFFTYCFWVDNINSFYKLFYWYSTYDVSLYSDRIYLIAFSFISFLTIASLFLKTPKTLTVLNNFRRSWILVLINLITAIFLIVLINNKNGSELIYLCFPTAIIIANGMEIFEKKWYSDIIIIICILFPLLILFL